MSINSRPDLLFVDKTAYGRPIEAMFETCDLAL